MAHEKAWIMQNLFWEYNREVLSWFKQWTCFQKQQSAGQTENILATMGQYFHPSLLEAEGTKRMAQLHSEIGREPAAGFRKINKRKRRTENDEDGNGKAAHCPKGVKGGFLISRRRQDWTDCWPQVGGQKRTKLWRTFYMSGCKQRRRNPLNALPNAPALSARTHHDLNFSKAGRPFQLTSYF